MDNHFDPSQHGADSDDFFAKLGKVVRYIPFARDIVAMYFSMMDDATPIWVKLQIAAAIAYFVMPLDAIPDLMPIVGYGDDAAVVTAALGMVSTHVTREHYRQADAWLS
ncbi:MAG: YkvA family protein [Polyangiales bacterium]